MTTSGYIKRFLIVLGGTTMGHLAYTLFGFFLESEGAFYLLILTPIVVPLASVGFFIIFVLFEKYIFKFWMSRKALFWISFLSALSYHMAWYLIQPPLIYWKDWFFIVIQIVFLFVYYSLTVFNKINK